MKNKAHLPAALALALAACGAAQAQSSVTIYGLVDAGVTWTNHLKSASGGDLWALDTGSSQGNRFGFRGSEDLGGGVRANFVLENGFSLDTGVLGQGGLLFWRQASVDLSSERLGALSLGRIYDPLGEVFPAYAIASNTPAGLMAWSLPTYAAGGAALNNRVWGAGVNNAVRYVSPEWGGFSVRALYGFGETTASTNNGSTQALSLTYARGGFQGSLAGYVGHDASATLGDIRILAAGAAYQFELLKLFGMVSQVSFDAGTQPRATTAELGATYLVTPALVLGAGLQGQRRNNGAHGAEQLTLTADYLLSKRTDAYVALAHGRDRQFNAQVVAALGGVSSVTSQTGARVGIRHRF